MRKIDFANGRITQNIILTAAPMLVAQIINLLYNIVDRIYIGRIAGVGTEALGAVGLCFPVIILVTAFTNMYGNGGAPLFAMENGRRRPDRAAAILNSSFRLLVVTALILTIAGEAGCRQILILFGASEKELIYAVPYLRIYLLGTVAAMVSVGMNPFLNAQGFASLGMMTVLIGACANIILDPVFIFALNMGVRGAAIATVIAQILSAAFVMKFLLGPKNTFRLESTMAIGEEKRVFPRASDIIGLGMASFIMQVTNALVSIVCNRILIAVGSAVYVSVMTIINSVRQILDTPLTAIAEGSSPVLSFSYGARKPKEVRKAIAVMSAMCIGYTLIMWAFIEWKPGFLVSIFTSDPNLQELALRPLHLYFLAFIFQSFQFSGQTIFKALNKKRQAIFFSLFRKVVIVVPMTILLAYMVTPGTDGVFMAEPVSNLIGGIACFTTMMLTILPELRRMDEENTIG